MKQLILFLSAFLLYVAGASAQSSNIPLKQGPGNIGGPRTVVQLPVASIDGQVLTISYADEADFCVTVTDASGATVYVGEYTTREATIILPQLPEGSYCLRIEDEEYAYSGEFEVTN